jgi:hypothetical protein
VEAYFTFLNNLSASDIRELVKLSPGLSWQKRHTTKKKDAVTKIWAEI